jgi:ribosome-associated heat shock protein Hsp15
VLPPLAGRVQVDAEPFLAFLRKGVSDKPVERFLQRQRLDKWLWHARVVRARASAAALIEAGHVRINGTREKAPGHAVKTGDVVTVGLDRTVRVLKVTGFADRRGDASAAAVLYEDLTGSPGERRDTRES